MEGRIMGIDVGDVRTGIAMSDPLGMVASPHSVLQVESLEADCASIAAVAQEHEIVQIVVGMPLTKAGEVGTQAEKVNAFIERLKTTVSVPVVTQDERLSSRSAERALIEADVSRKKRKQIIDKVAAQQILQLYLDRQARERQRRA